MIARLFLLLCKKGFAYKCVRIRQIVHFSRIISVENVFWGITPKRAQYGMVQEDTKGAIGFRGEGCGAAPRCKE